MMANTTHLEILVEEPSMEAFERLLKQKGYFKNGRSKVEIARTIAAHINPDCNRSHSFVKFRNALIEAMA